MVQKPFGCCDEIQFRFESIFSLDARTQTKINIYLSSDDGDLVFDWILFALTWERVSLFHKVSFHCRSNLGYCCIILSKFVFRAIISDVSRLNIALHTRPQLIAPISVDLLCINASFS